MADSKQEFIDDMNALAKSINNKANMTGKKTVKELKVVVDGIIKPSGSLSITSNGTHDVTNYASVNVNVPTGGGELFDAFSFSVSSFGQPSTGTGISISIDASNVLSTGSSDGTYIYELFVSGLDLDLNIFDKTILVYITLEIERGYALPIDVSETNRFSASPQSISFFTNVVEVIEMEGEVRTIRSSSFKRIA